MVFGFAPQISWMRLSGCFDWDHYTVCVENSNGKSKFESRQASLTVVVHNFFKEIQMKMTVRACLLAAVLLSLGASSLFAQATFIAGAPAGSVFTGTASYAYPVSREGLRETLAPVSLCTTGAAAGSGTSPFATGDVYRIRYYAGATTVQSPTVVSGALNVGTQVAAYQTAATPSPLGVTATAQVDTIAGVGGAAATTVSSVYVTVTSGLAAGSPGYPACITVAGLRFDVADTTNQTTGAAIPLVTAFQAIVDATATAAGPLSPPVAAAPGTPPPSVITTGAFPALAVSCPAGLVVGANGACLTGVSTGTLAAGAVGGVNSATGAVLRKTGGSNFVPAPGTVIPNGAYNLAGTLTPSTIPSLAQNSGGTSTAILSIAQAAAPLFTGITPVAAIPNTIGGGLLRSNGTGANAAAVTGLLQAGATTGTQIQVTVAGMPAGSSVTFGNDATVVNASGSELMHMSLVGSGALTANGSILYVVTNNVTGGVATSIDLPFTVTEASSGASFGTATVTISVLPASGNPSYLLSNSGVAGLTIVPSPTAVAANPAAALLLYSISLSSSTRTYPFVTLNGSGTLTQDTGIALCNTGGAFFGTTFTPATPNGSQQGTFSIDLFPMITSSPASPIHITSDALKKATNGLSSGGVLAPGGCWAVLFSQLLSDMGVTAGSSGVTGYIRITTNWNATSAGFAYISQFANGQGTMGYVAQ